MEIKYELTKTPKEKPTGALGFGHIFTDHMFVMDYDEGKGLPFRDAYKATGELVAQCIDRGLTLETLPLEDYRAVCDLFDQDVYHKINLDTCVATRISEGGPCPESVERQIGKVQAFLDKYPL